MILDRGGREDIRQQWGVISGVATGYTYIIPENRGMHS